MGLTYEGRRYLGKFLGPIERHLRAIECHTSSLGTGGEVFTTNSYTSGLQVLSGTTASTGTLTLGANVSDTETVTIGTTVYTFETIFSDTANFILIGGTASDSIDNLIAAINGAAGEGSTYGTGTIAHADVTAAAGVGDTMDVTAIIPGTAGDAIATTETSATASWGAATLTGGAGAPTAYTFLATEEMREVEIWADADTWYRVIVTKADGSTVVATVASAGRWEYNSSVNESVITGVSLLNLTATDTNYSINVVSRN